MSNACNCDVHPPLRELAHCQTSLLFLTPQFPHVPVSNKCQFKIIKALRFYYAIKNKSVVRYKFCTQLSSTRFNYSIGWVECCTAQNTYCPNFNHLLHVIIFQQLLSFVYKSVILYDITTSFCLNVGRHVESLK